MTIDEARICLVIQLEVKHRLGRDYEAKALQLGIEALKREKGRRDYRIPGWNTLLSGETEASPIGEPLSSPQQAEGYPAEEK